MYINMWKQFFAEKTEKEEKQKENDEAVNRYGISAG